MKTPKNIDFDSPLNIPAHQVGSFKVKRELLPKGKKVTVVSMRNAIMTGIKPCSMILEKPRVIHKLMNDGSLMFSDCPQEIFMHQEAIKNANGHVLVGGLGLGYYASKIFQKPNVKSVTVVEKEKDIINLIKPHIHSKIKIIYGDLFHYLESGKAKFNYAYFDIWYGTGEMVWESYVMPLRRLVWDKYGKKRIDCWAEQEMETQIQQGILNLVGGLNTIHFDRTVFKIPKPEDVTFSLPYFLFMRKIHSVPQNFWNSDDGKKFFITMFMRGIGSPQWEKFWDVDSNIALCEKIKMQQEKIRKQKEANRGKIKVKSN